MSLHDGKVRILSAGMPRAGSTWMFNCLRFILMETGGPFYSSWIDNYNPEEPSMVHLIKVHDVVPFADNCQKVFTSRRDLRDIVASLRSKNWISASPKEVIAYLHLRLHHYELYDLRSDYEVAYEEMIKDKLAEIKRLAEELCVVVDAGEIHRKVESLKFTDSSSDGRYDVKNLLLRDHFGNGGVGYYREVLTPEVIIAISTQFKGWLEERNYEV